MSGILITNFVHYGVSSTYNSLFLGLFWWSAIRYVKHLAWYLACTRYYMAAMIFRIETILIAAIFS